MEITQIILWVIGIGFAFNFGLMLTMWHGFNNRMDKLDDKLTGQIGKLDEKVTDIDRRLCRLEGAFASKDCCMIKDDRHLKKAE